MLKVALHRVAGGADLDREQARAAMLTIMRGDASPAQIAGLLVALRIKGESVEEIAGFAEAMRSVAEPVDLGSGPLVDTCGTGGDGAGTFNISTSAALVAAGAGVRVAKHGNRSVSSACGSADVLEALGVRLLSSAQALRRCVDRAGLAFLFAPDLHPAMQHAISPRRELGMRTVFNVLGPLCNPAGAQRQVIGVYDAALVPSVARVLGHLGAEHALVVHGAGGLDEISTLGTTEVAEWDGSAVRAWSIDPGDLGIGLASREQLAGGDAATNAAIVRSVIAGDRGPARDIVVLNAGAAIWVGGGASTLREGIDAAADAIDDGAAARTLDTLVEVTGEYGA